MNQGVLFWSGDKRAPRSFTKFLLRLAAFLEEDPHPGSASSLVARDHWGIFELIIKESGDKGSDGKGTPLALYPRSHHLSLALLSCSRVPPMEEADQG